MNYGVLVGFIYFLIGLWAFLLMYGYLMDHLEERMAVLPISHARAAFGMTFVCLVVVLGWPLFFAVAYYLGRNKEHE